eukprot:7175152-Pyramimonas_sp.AAC.1
MLGGPPPSGHPRSRSRSFGSRPEGRRTVGLLVVWGVPLTGGAEQPSDVLIGYAQLAQHDGHAV